MFYAGIVVCTAACQLVLSYPGVISHDDCLVALAGYNVKIRGFQIAPKMTGSLFFYNGGCFEIENKTITENGVKTVLWKKFGPAAYESDKNIKRILKRRY